MEAGRRVWRSLSSLWAALAAPDPGLIRLRFAGRVTLSVALTVVVLFLIGRFTGISIVSMALGIIASLLASVAVRDPEPSRQRLTTMLMPIPAAAGFTAASALSRWPLLADAGFLTIIFVAVYGRRLGPRWAALGMIGTMAYFLGEFLHPPLAQVPDQLVGLGAGTGMAYLVRFGLLPDRPGEALPRVLRAIYRRVGILLGEVEDALVAGRWSEIRRRRVHHGLAGLNEAVLMAEDQLDDLEEKPGAASPGEIRVRLLALELAAERLVNIALASLPPPSARGRLPLRLRALERRLRDGPTGAPGRGGRTVAAAMADRETGNRDSGPARRLALALAELQAALAAMPATGSRKRLLELDGRSPDRGEAGERDAKQDRDEKREEAQTYGPLQLRPTTRQAIQATVACGLAIAVGHWISPQRWFWAVITAFVMFTGTRTRAETIYKGLQRVAGTLAGVVAGVLIATALAGHPNLGRGLMLACIFLGFYFLQVSYALMIFWITIMIALLYGAMGYFTEPLLVVRLEETAVGAAAGILVSIVLLPVHTRDAIRDAMRAFLKALDGVVDNAVHRLAGESAGDVSSIELTRELDRKFHGVRDAASPLTLGWGLRAPGLKSRGLAMLMSCAYWARELSLLAGSRTAFAEAALLEPIRTAAGRVHDDIGTLYNALDRPHGTAAETFAGTNLDGAEFDRAEAAIDRLAAQGGHPRATIDPLLGVARTLRHIDEAIRHLGRHLDEP